MGQKVNPNALRCDINRSWISKWEPRNEKQAAQWIVEDEKIRKFFLSTYRQAQIVEILIERTQSKIKVVVKAGQPGLILGKAKQKDDVLAHDATVEVKPVAAAPAPAAAPTDAAAPAPAPAPVAEAKPADAKKPAKPAVAKIDNVLAINKIVGKKIKVELSVIHDENASLSARVIAREIADAIENRVSFRVAQKMGMKKAMMAHAKGVKTNVSGRLGGVEMAREEGYSQGEIPLSTFRANIDYAIEEAHTTYGQIGVKVWINRGDMFKPVNRENSRGGRNGDRKPFNRARRPRREESANVLKLPKEEKPVATKPAKTAKKDGE